MRIFVPKSQKKKAAEWLRRAPYHEYHEREGNTQYIVFPKPPKPHKKIVKIPCFFPPSFKSSQEKVERFLPNGNVRQRYPVIEKRFPNDRQIQVHIRPHKDPKYEYIICMKAKKKIPIDFSIIHENKCLVEFVRNGSVIESNLYVQIQDKYDKQSITNGRPPYSIRG